jgi:hypothetical protein
MAASWLINVANSAGKESPNPDISFFALSANNPERRLAVGFALPMALKAD